MSISRRTVLIGGLALTMTSPAVGRPADLALTRVTTVDPHQRDVTVLLAGDRIVAVGKNLPLPRGVRVVDLAGKYLIPGLVDMHAHSIESERISPPLYALNGVTTVREMAGSAVVRGWRDEIERGRLLGPRWIIASSIIDGYPSLLAGPDEEPTGILTVRNAAEARMAVRRVKAEGADFVKVYSRLSQEAYLAIADEARRQRITFAGHLPDLVRVEEAVAAGHRSIEHLHALPLATSGRDAEVRRALAAIRIQPGDYNSWFRQVHPIEWLAYRSPSAARREAVLERLAVRGTRVVPTAIMHKLLDMPEDAVLDDERLEYVPVETREFWQFVLEEFYKKGRTPEEMAQQRVLYEHRLGFVDAMRQAGVPMLAGSEAGLVYAYPGFSLHDELAELVRAGLTPLEALRTATVEPARFLGMQHLLGSIRPGRQADLVVLDGDPLTDITNISRIHAVVVRGRFIGSAERKRLLADVASAAASVPSARGGCPCHMPSSKRQRVGENDSPIGKPKITAGRTR